MKKFLAGIIIVAGVLGFATAGHAGMYWGFGIGGYDNYSCGGYAVPAPPIATYTPVVPCAPPVVVYNPYYSPYSYGSCYRPYYRPHHYNGYYHRRRYCYGGAYHPAPRPVPYRRRHYRNYRHGRRYGNGCNGNSCSIHRHR